ncbi:MAG TPA: hypothetical protein VHW43_02545 [Puia sp.]|jgi:hypothetical protein|nr:hypothetical protein [Puia sp.]
MAEPFPLYVDEIGPDKIKATVSHSNTVNYNLKIILLARKPFHDPGKTIIEFLKEEINGICITPVGKFVCMVVNTNGQHGMIFLDLIDKMDLAKKMAEKLGHVDLRERFMEVYMEIIDHPSRHNWFKLVVGKAELM